MPTAKLRVSQRSAVHTGGPAWPRLWAAQWSDSRRHTAAKRATSSVVQFISRLRCCCPSWVTQRSCSGGQLLHREARWGGG